LDPYTYDYWNATFQRNKDAPVSHPGEYSTDLIASKAFGLLDDAVAADKPFFLSIAPIGPHSHMSGNRLSDGDLTPDIPQSAERHRHLFPGAKVPRTANFNPEDPSGGNWIRRQPKLTEEQISYNDDFYRGRLQALQAVDELVDGLFNRLEEHGILDNTYVFYTSDNGFHIGQHRLQPGKETGYEEDIHIPLIIRGPGVAKDTSSSIVTAHIDLVPTFLSLAGAPLPPDLDGEPIPLNRETSPTTALAKREHVNVEYWGWVLSEGKWGFNGGADRIISNATYKALRVVSEEYDLYYSVWCTNEHELYDMTVSVEV
jgi:arylsulfatase A-like enzyme